MPEVGDSIRVLGDLVRDCPHPVHATAPHGCLGPDAEGEPRRGAIYATTTANGGPETGHGNLVVLDCVHQHVVALSAEEMVVTA